jgi:GntR family transcriptional regulator, arabinose operon transcriptional repressor
MALLYQNIVDFFEKEIFEHRINTGDKIPTEKEIMQEFKVSRITASRAVNELVGKGLIYRVKGTGSFVKDIQPESEGNPVPDNNFIAVILPFKKNFGLDIVSGIETELQSRGYYLTFHCTNHDVTVERKIIEDLIGKVKGFIIYPCSNSTNLDLFSNMYINQIPFIFIDRAIQEFPACSVLSDNMGGFFHLTKDVISKGHQRIAFIASHIDEVESEKERYNGYCRALIESGIPLNNKYIYKSYESHPLTPQDEHNVVTKNARKALSYFQNLSEPPTALMCVNDATACEILIAALNQKIKIPETYSITGFDNLDFTSYLQVPLTTVSQDFTKMGEIAASIVTDMISGKSCSNEPRILPTYIIHRSSVLMNKTPY